MVDADDLTVLIYNYNYTIYIWLVYAYYSYSEKTLEVEPFNTMQFNDMSNCDYLAMDEQDIIYMGISTGIVNINNIDLWMPNPNYTGLKLTVRELIWGLSLFTL